MRQTPERPQVPILAACLFVSAAMATAEPLGEGPLSRGEIEVFEQRIRPVLILKCFRCHSSEAKELASGLSLESREAMLRGGKRGPAIVPGSPEKSLLVRLLKNWKAENREPDLVMPPDRRLGRRAVDDIAEWIQKGARWPATTVRVFVPRERNWDWHTLREGHWAWKPIRRPALPAVGDAAWPKTPVDYFLLTRLEREGITPAAPADRRTLLRRLYFDLLGLPPEPADVEAFVEDRAPDAYSRVVDRLLASSHYGERWGRHWLDVARYSDGYGAFQDQAARPVAFRYRDWVVSALNEDMPYDEFVRLQIAGDLLAPGEQDVAVGFFAVGPTYTSDGGTPAGEAEARAETLDDRVDTLARGFLGLTVACARCHDHKFDPIPTQDYYSLAGVFNNTVLADAAVVPEAVVARYDAAQKTLKDFEAELAAWKNRHEAKYVGHFFPQAGTYLREALRFVQRRRRGEDLDKTEVAKAAGLRPRAFLRWADYITAKNPPRDFPPLASWYALDFESRARVSDSEIERLVTEFESYLLPRLERRREALADFERRLTARETRDPATGVTERPQPELDPVTEKLRNGVLRRLFSLEGSLEEFLTPDEKRAFEELQAEHQALREAVPPKYPVVHTLRDLGNADMRVAERGDFLKPGPLAPRRFLRILAGEDPPRFDEGSGRLGLANAVASAENPLTARVFVNRVWQHHFGKALVRTPSNFGLFGERPTHPDLLDWLASQFVLHGWSVKALHRAIVLSAAYQMQSRHDERKFAIDGDNRFVWRMNPRRLDVEAWRDGLLAVAGNLETTLGGKPTGELLKSSRRTLYTAISRNGDHFPSDEFLQLFDFPSARVSSAKRIASTVPQQYLFMLNSSFMVAQAKLFASRLARERGSDEERVERAYALLFGRRPEPEEATLALNFLASSAPDAQEALTLWERYAQVLLSSNEFFYLR